MKLAVRAPAAGPGAFIDPASRRAAWSPPPAPVPTPVKVSAPPQAQKGPPLRERADATAAFATAQPGRSSSIWA